MNYNPWKTGVGVVCLIVSVVLGLFCLKNAYLAYTITSVDIGAMIKMLATIFAVGEGILSALFGALAYCILKD